MAISNEASTQAFTAGFIETYAPTRRPRGQLRRMSVSTAPPRRDRRCSGHSAWPRICSASVKSAGHRRHLFVISSEIWVSIHPPTLLDTVATLRPEDGISVAIQAIAVG